MCVLLKKQSRGWLPLPGFGSRVHVSAEQLTVPVKYPRIVSVRTAQFSKLVMPSSDILMESWCTSRGGDKGPSFLPTEALRVLWSQAQSVAVQCHSLP